MGTRKSEWLAAIKPILDREEARRDAKELAKELGDILEINIDANPENLKQLTDEFNSQLSKMGKQPIVFSEKTLKGIVNQFADAIASGFAKGADVGVAEALKRQLDGLKKQRQEIIKEQNKIKQNVQARSRIEKLETFEIGTAKPLKVEGDIGQEAQKLVDVLYKSADQIEQAEKKYGKASVEYVNTVLDAQEAYNKYLRMQKTIKLMPSAERSSISKDVRASYDVLGKDRDSYEVAGGINIPFEEDFAAEKILDAFEELSDVFEGISDNVTSLQKQLQQVGAEIDSIAKKIREIGTSDGTAFADAKDGLKTLQEVEAAYGRISKKKATKGGHKPIDKVADALEYTPGSASLTTLRNRYSTSLSSGADWEEQYQWLIKFVKEYEAQLERINAEEDKTKKKNDLATLKKYTELYKELKPLASEAEVSLLEVAKKAGYQPEKVVGDMDSVVALDTQMAQKAREEAAKRAEAEKRAEESLRQQRIEEEKIAKAKAKQRLEDEKIAEAKRRAAEEAEKEARARSFATNGTGGDSTSHKQTTLYDMAQDVNGKEKFAYLNTDTGKISEYIEGGYEGVTKTAIKELLNSIGETMNATIHSHPESIAAPSDDDIQSFVNDIGEFKRNFILAGKQLAEIDFSELTREQAQMIADVYKVNVSNTEDERYGRLMTSPMKELGIPSVDSDRVFAAVSEQLKARFPALLSDIDAYIEKLRAVFTATPIIDLSQGELEDVISDEVESDFKNQDRSQQSEIYEITKELIDNITGIPAMYQQELQNIFKQTIEYLDFDAFKIFKLYDVDDFQANLDTAYGRTIEDVSTARDEADTHRKNADAINAEAEAQEELNKVTAAAPDAKQSEASSSSGGTSSAELEAMQKQIAELQEQKNQEMEAKDAEIAQIRETSAAQLEAIGNEKVTLQNDLDLARQQVQSAQDEATASQAREAEANQKLAEQEALNRQLREQLENVKTGVNEETGTSVGADDLKRILGEVIYKVKIAHDDNDKQENKIALDETALEGTLKRVFSKFIDPVAETSESRQEVEPWALEKTLLNVKEVLGQIQTNTAQKQSLEIAPAKTEVGPVLATEGTLVAIKTAVEAINKKTSGEIGGVVKSDNAETAEMPAKKKQHKDGTISHGQAKGSPGSMNKLFDYYYWIEEQIEQFKDNELYVAQLQDVQAKILPKVVEYYKQLEEKGLEYPAWIPALDEKHALHMSKIQGTQASAEINNPLSKLYEKYGMLMERADAAGKNLAGQLYDEAEDVLQIIAELEKSIEISPKMEKQLSDSLEKGRSTEENKQYEKLAMKSDKDEVDRLKNITSLEKEIGKLRAEQDASSNEGVKAAIEEEISLRQELIELQKQGLEMDADVEAYRRKSLANQTKEAKDYAKQEQAEIKKVFEDAKKAAQKDAMLGKAGNAVGRAETAWMNTGDIMPEASPEVNALIDEYYQKIIALRQEKEKLRQSESITQAEKDAVIQHTQNLNRMTAEVQELVSEYQKLSGANVNEANTRSTSLTGESSIQQYQQQMNAYVNEITHGQGQIKSFDAATKTLTYTVKTGSHEFTEYTVALRRVDDSLVSVQGATKKTETFFEATKRKIGEISSYITGMGAINLAKNQLKQGIQYIKEIDDALTELKKVTNETTETYDKFLKTAAKTADKTGSTMTNIIQSTADWVKLGNTLADATKLAETTSVLLNVSEFESIDSATSALVSTMQAFGYAAKDSMSIVDVMNEIGNTYAVSSDGIATALQDSASSLVAANNSYEEAVAMIAAGNRVIQDPSSLGSGLRTIALRLRGTSVEGEDDDGLITSTSKLQSKIKALSGVDILTDTGAYKSTYQILLEISDVWEQMSDIDQAECCLYVQKCA